MTLFQFSRTLLLVAALSACGGPVQNYFNEYKPDIEQGNVLDQEMVSKLKPGQTKDQVRFILGTPILTDMFHVNRWDYVYRMLIGSSGAVQMRKFSVFFDANGRLVKVSGDVAPSELGDVKEVQTQKVREIDLGSIEEGYVAPPHEDKGFFGKMFETMGF